MQFRITWFTHPCILLYADQYPFYSFHLLVFSIPKSLIKCKGGFVLLAYCPEIWQNISSDLFSNLRRINMAIVDVSDQTFQNETGSGTVLVDFWAPWCGPCKMIAPVLEELDKEIGDTVKIAKLNVDDNPDTASRFGVMSIPTLIVFKDGEPVDKLVGFQSKDALKSAVSKHT